MKFLEKIVVRSPLAPQNGDIPEELFMEALYIASPVVYYEYLKYKNNEITDPKQIQKLRYSIQKYLSRASTRCTPYGLFAGINLSNWGSSNKITTSADSLKALSRHTRLDYNVVSQLANYICKLESVKPHLKFNANSSIQRIGHSYRYIEFEFQNSKRQYKLSKVDYSTYLETLLLKANESTFHP